jgi:hypothetical protein
MMIISSRTGRFINNKVTVNDSAKCTQNERAILTSVQFYLESASLL